MYLFQEDHDIAVDFDAEHNDEEGERDVGDDGDEGVVANGDEAGEDEAQGAGAADRVLPVDQVLHGRLGRGKVDHVAGEEMGGCCKTSWFPACSSSCSGCCGGWVDLLRFRAVEASEHASAGV